MEYADKMSTLAMLAIVPVTGIFPDADTFREGLISGICLTTMLTSSIAMVCIANARRKAGKLVTA